VKPRCGREAHTRVGVLIVFPTEWAARARGAPARAVANTTHAAAPAHVAAPGIAVATEAAATVVTVGTASGARPQQKPQGPPNAYDRAARLTPSAETSSADHRTNTARACDRAVRAAVEGSGNPKHREAALAQAQPVKLTRATTSQQWHACTPRLTTLHGEGGPGEKAARGGEASVRACRCTRAAACSSEIPWRATSLFVATTPEGFTLRPPLGRGQRPLVS
jgi:hypothetical protein